MRIRWLGIVAALLALPSVAQAWWNDDWAYRSQVELDPSISAAQVVPVRLHVGNFAFEDARPDGADLRFVAGDDRTPLNFHFEIYDRAEQLAVAWVRLPPGGGAQPKLWLYYGNGSPALSAAADSAASYEPTQTAVFHFTEKAGQPADSTGFRTPVAQFSAQLSGGGVVDGGLRLSPTDSLALADTPALRIDAARGFTLSTWLKLSDSSTPALIFSRSAADAALELGIAGGHLYAQLRDGSAQERAEAADPWPPGQWRHLALSWSDRLVAYVDGRAVLSLALPARPIGGQPTFGAHAGLGAGFSGELDELQLADGAWPATRILANFVAQDPVLDAVRLTSEEESDAGTGHYRAVLQTLANAVSTDGWVIIGLIGLLGVISVDVMLSKLRLLRRIQKTNTAFLDRFRAQGADPTALARAAPESGKTMANLGLVALYGGGVNEFRRQCALVLEDGGNALAAAHLEVIKANIDTSFVNEATRLNQSMVLLTLAVSAAPFLGLLGTVVGIMVTFGSIALAGDVNVNTIAPGVAAALSTTVAGLIVAIPVMFGYNFLTTRIRELTMAMDVFANELVGRLAAARLSI